MIRLIALDLDQTVFGSDLTIAARVQGTIDRAQQAGRMVTIATGREAPLAARFARELKLVVPIVCAQGGCIFDHVQEKVLREVRLDPGWLPPIVDAARRFGWNIHFEASDRLYFPAESGHPPVLFELLRHSNWVRVGDLLRDMPAPPHKVIVTLDRPEDRARIVAEMESAVGGLLSIVPSHPHLVEGLPGGVDKGNGLAWLARYLGIEREEVMAIGDSEADVPMIRWAGLGIAMGNGCAEVKAAAAWVAPSLADHGAAAAIEKYALVDR